MVDPSVTVQIDRGYFNDMPRPKPSLRHANTMAGAAPGRNNKDLFTSISEREEIVSFAEPVVKKRHDRLNETSADRKDRAFHIQDDTEKIKAKANLLDGEIKSMKTKLHRIESLVRKRDVRRTDDKAIDNDFLEEFESIKAKNARAKERI